MRSHPCRTAKLGDLIVAAFDEAAFYSADPGEVSLLATQAIARLLRSAARATPTQHTAAGPRTHVAR
jgi:hypothetical protein